MSLNILTVIHYLFQLKLCINKVITGVEYGVYPPSLILGYYIDRRMENLTNALLEILSYIFLYISFNDISFVVGLCIHLGYLIGIIASLQSDKPKPKQDEDVSYISFKWKQLVDILDVTLHLHGVIRLAQLIGLCDYSYFAILPVIYYERNVRDTAKRSYR